MDELNQNNGKQMYDYRINEAGDKKKTDRNTKIMVTGANGFLGSRLADYLHKSCTVYRIGHSQIDITDRREAADAVREIQPDFVIHCAALSDVGFCEEHPSLCEQVNVIGPLYLAEACKTNKARFIFMSSDQIYHNSTAAAANREEDTVEPTNIYGISKLRAEQELLALLPDTVCLRLSWMYDLPVLGKRTHRNLLLQLLETLIRNEELTLPVYDFRGITWVREVVTGIEKALLIPGGIYNFGSANEFSTFETVQKWMDVLGCRKRRDLLTADETRFRDRPRNLRIDNRKIEDFGIRFSDSVCGLKRCLEDYGIAASSVSGN